MDIRQPSISLGSKGDVAGAVNARFMQDTYRALKTPNFALTNSASQGFGSGVWTDISWNTVVHNNLNLYDTVNNRISPQGVPGMYFLNAHVNLYFSSGTPTASTPIILAIRSPSGVVRASMVYEIITGVTYSTIGFAFGMSVSCLDYLSGLCGTGENDYRVLSIHNNTGATARVYGSDVPEYLPKFQGFKIPF